MRVRGRSLSLTIVVALGVVVVSRAWGQALPSSAKVDTEPLDLTEPDRFAVPSVLEPVRRVTLVATADGVVRSQDARAGAAVREGQEIAQLDRGEAGARLKIAQAEVKEQQTFVEAAKEAEKAQGTGGQGPALKCAVVAAQARLDAAHARAELSQIAFDQCSLRAPFSGKVMASHVSDGQYVTKGTVIAELADVSSLRTLVPLTRAGASVGGSVTLSVEGQPVPGKIQSLLPLTEELAVLRELASPISAAWVVVPNTAGTLEPGQRVVSPALPVLADRDGPRAFLLEGRGEGKGQGEGCRLDRAGHPQRVRDQRESARAWQPRPGARAGHRPAASDRCADRLDVGAAAAGYVDPVQPGHRGRR